MMAQNADRKREQIQMFCMDDLVPPDHLLRMMDKVSHSSTFGKNYARRFKDTDLFEQIFSRILQECYKYGLIDPAEVFADVIHVKARANSRKMQKRIAHEEALFFEDDAHGKGSLKEKKGDDTDPPLSGADGGKEKMLRKVPQTRKAAGIIFTILIGVGTGVITAASIAERFLSSS